MLRDILAAWTKKNLRFGECQKELLRQYDMAVHECRNPSFIVGRDLVRRRRPYLVQCFYGELFVFGLSAGQVRALRIEPNNLSCRHGSPATPNPPGGTAYAVLDDLQFHDRGRISLARPIRTRCRFSVQGAALSPYAVSIFYDLHLDRFITQFVYPDNALLHGKGTIDLCFPPLAMGDDANLADWTGVVTVFLRLVGYHDASSPDGRVPLSNVCAALIDVR